MTTMPDAVVLVTLGIDTHKHTHLDNWLAGGPIPVARTASKWSLPPGGRQPGGVHSRWAARLGKPRVEVRGWTGHRGVWRRCWQSPTDSVQPHLTGSS
jgi:hypothetical protein